MSTPIADMVEKMLSTGIPPEMIVLAVRTIERATTSGDPVADRRRAFDRERKQRAAKSGIPVESKNGGSLSSLLPSSASVEIQKKEERSEDTRAREKTSSADDDWPNDYREQFWSTYPNKVGKPKALGKLDRARKRGVPWAELWGGLLRYIAKTDDRPWCNPQTWINEERWEDRPASVSRSQPRFKKGFADLALELDRTINERDYQDFDELPLAGADR